MTNKLDLDFIETLIRKNFLLGRNWIKIVPDTGYKIYQKFKFGNDIHRGIVKSVDGDDITILWDAVKNEENVIYGPEQEVISLDFFRTGYLHILKVLNSSKSFVACSKDISL